MSWLIDMIVFVAMVVMYGIFALIAVGVLYTPVTEGLNLLKVECVEALNLLAEVYIDAINVLKIEFFDALNLLSNN
jgi:hypothetical protein